MVGGESVDEILKHMTVEGVPTASVAVAYADLCGLDLPIFRVVDAVISGRLKVGSRLLAAAAAACPRRSGKRGSFCAAVLRSQRIAWQPLTHPLPSHAVDPWMERTHV